MNSLCIVGNLTRDPVSQVTKAGVPVCSFSVAVTNRRRGDGETDYFRVTAWRKLAEICGNLKKGKMVAVKGEVSVSTYTGQDGVTRASMDVIAETIDFLSPRDKEEKKEQEEPKGFTQVNDDDLPF